MHRRMDDNSSEANGSYCHCRTAAGETVECGNMDHVQHDIQQNSFSTCIAIGPMEMPYSVTLLAMLHDRNDSHHGCIRKPMPREHGRLWQANGEHMRGDSKAVEFISLSHLNENWVGFGGDFI